MAPMMDGVANGSETSPQGSWREWARHILIELERLNTFTETITTRLQENRTELDGKLSQLRSELQASISGVREGINKDVNDLRVEIAMLKVKAGVWGAVGAAIPIIGTLLIAYLVQHFKHTGP